MTDNQTQQAKKASSPAADSQVVSIPIHPTGIYTYKEAAALSKCSYVTIWRAVANGKLKATSVGNCIFRKKMSTRFGRS
jgi:excisionase family DNA binding protein